MQVATLAGINLGQYQRLEYGIRDFDQCSMKVGISICYVLNLDPFLLVLQKNGMVEMRYRRVSQLYFAGTSVRRLIYDEECPLALDFKRRLHDTIEMLILQGFKHMISGGAQGMDMMAAEAVLDLQKEYPDVTLEIAVPFEAQAAKWADDYHARWQSCIDRADVVTVLSHEYTKGCLFARNCYLVTQADILLACFDGKEGGTKNTVEYAQRNGCRVCLIPPVKKECRKVM